MQPPPPDPAPYEPRWRFAVCFLLLLAWLQISLGPRIWLSQWDLTEDFNAGVAEADAWLHHRLDIPVPGGDVAHKRQFDTAAFNGKCYNVFPPLIGALTVALSPLHKLLLDRTDVWLPWPYIALCFWPLPILAYVLLRRESCDAVWGAFLAAALLGGTAIVPALAFARHGHLGFVNHVLSQIGLLLLAADLLGRQRIWPALIGLLIAVWSRQMTILYALPLLWIAWRRQRLTLAAAGLIAIVAPLLVLNHLKFGNALDFGYRYIYVNRTGDWIADRCRQYGTFSAHFIPENAWYMHGCPPRIFPTLTSINIEGDPSGTSIWITTPLLLLVLIAAREWWRDPARRGLMLASLLVMAGALCYHNTGYIQIGYNRFALDFIPIWFAVIAPFTRGGWRTWFTISCTAWSMLYFSISPFT